MHEKLSSGLDEEVLEERTLLFGPNLIDIKIKSIPELLISEVIHPFYLFQVASCIFWYIDEYNYYASLILFMAICSIAWSIYTTRSSLVNLRNMAKTETEITVYRKKGFISAAEKIKSSQLVPGDIVEVYPNMPVPCDMLLIQGECVVNEAMLTGESNPILKYSVPKTDEIYIPANHKRFTLFCGTNIMECRTSTAHDSEKGALALVYATGFGTIKGSLFLSILFPKPLHFKFYSDSYKFLLIMILFAIGGFIKTLVDSIPQGYPPGEAIKDALDLITIAVPPALPIVLTVGIGFAVNRLKDRNIYCTSPPRINFAGKINLFCFDKTGTLTEDNLSMEGIVPCENGVVQNLEIIQDFSNLPEMLLSVLTTAHSIGVIQGHLVGHPVDVQMFQATKWIIEDRKESDNSGILSTVTHPSKSHRKYGVFRRFEFLPALQRMTVISQDLRSGEFLACTKGAPEVIQGLCVPQSVPHDFDDILAYFTQRGFYVLGCAAKVLTNQISTEVDTVSRDVLECNMEFCGFLVLENKLKPETTAVIKKLAIAKIHCVMITGDNILTGISVSKKCHMLHPEAKVLFTVVTENGTIEWKNVDNLGEVFKDPFAVSRRFSEKRDHLLQDKDEFELAMTGKALEIMSKPENQMQYDELLQRVRVYARVSPDQKTQIIESLIDYGYFVGMTGDGTNDCGALRAAHVGLSLSDAEASVVAPFTDRNKTVAGVLKLIREGRGALVNSFVAFKYMILYPVIQYVTALRLYHIGSKLGDIQYLYQDAALVLPLSITMLMTGASKRLHSQPPTSNLFAPTILASLFAEVCIQVLFLALINVILSKQDWFVPFDGKGEDEFAVKNYENTVSYWFSNFQYIIVAIAFSKGNNFRRAFFTNYLYVIFLLIGIGLSIMLVFLPQSNFTEDVMETIELPTSFKWHIMLWVGVNTLTSLVMEFIVIEGPVALYLKTAFGKKHILS
eukprot:TRINITY_DN3878_c0_g1_i2.p1 TRINITY_DN3878_c0_g1~~TRINITY_DN3878_c0_g1_i2.p1  ORF type:complete len:959 (-),score=239.16 TRINITY_DN3878_c0_g1_i2:217-3093(-)